MSNIDICKTCTNRKPDFQQGLLCKLTNTRPNFENNCPNYNKDNKVDVFKGGEIRANSERGKIAILLIYIVLACEILSLISGYLQYNLLNKIASGMQISPETANANDMREGATGIVFLIAYIISCITFIMWFRRAYHNLHQKVPNLSFTEVWAAGSWFVPFLNLYRPYQIMKELYEETSELLKKTNRTINTNLNVDTLGIWWALWILNGVLGQVVFRIARNAQTVDELIQSTVFDMIGAVAGIVLALVTIPVIKRYTNAEEALFPSDLKSAT